VWTGRDHSHPDIESRGHKSRSRVGVSVSEDLKAVGLTSILDQRQLVFLVVSSVRRSTLGDRVFG